MDNEQTFIEILRQNWLHMRHQETLRMWIGNVFIAIVVGVLAFLGTKEVEEVPWFLPAALLIISVLSLLMTLKVNEVFSEAQKSIKNIFIDEKIPLGKDWEKYVGGLKSKGKWKYLKVRCLYVALYSVAIAASLSLLVWVLVKGVKLE